MYEGRDHSRVCPRLFKNAARGSAVYVQRDTEAARICFPESIKKKLLALEGDQGGRQIMQKHPEDIWMMEVDERELRDIDQPSDLRQLRLELEQS